MRVCARNGCDGEVVGRSNKLYCSERCSNVACVTKWRQRLKSKAVAYLGGECCRCGWNEHDAGLVPHHVDPSQKTFSVGDVGNTRSWKRVQAELDKCVLLCSNCHAVVHATNDAVWLILAR